MRTILVVAALGLTIAGCQRAPALAPAASVEIVGSDTARLKAEGNGLANAGVPSGPEPVSPVSAPAAPSASDRSRSASTESKSGHILGKITWKDIEPRTRMVRLNVSLIGDEVENRDVKLGRPDFKIGKGYEFRNVPPGAYRLVAEASGTPMWDVKVVVPADKQTTLDLTESNAAVTSAFEPPTD